VRGPVRCGLKSQRAEAVPIHARAGSGEMIRELPGARDNGTVKQQLNPSNAGMCVMDETE